MATAYGAKASVVTELGFVVKLDKSIEQKKSFLEPSFLPRLSQ